MDYSAVASNVQMDYSTVQAIFTISAGLGLL